MAVQVLEKRVDDLENRVTRLEELPIRMDRLESQILQLRAEMVAGFSAVREAIDEARRETRVLFEEVVSRISVLGEVGHVNARNKRKRR